MYKYRSNEVQITIHGNKSPKEGSCTLKQKLKLKRKPTPYVSSFTAVLCFTSFLLYRLCFHEIKQNKVGAAARLAHDKVT